MEEPVNTLAIWLDFIKAFIWPAVVVIAFFLFRREFRLLLERVSSFRMGDAEFEFQASSPDAETPKALVSDKAPDFLPGGFFSADGIKSLVVQSGLLPNADEPLNELLIFSTQKQKTWLVFSHDKVFCFLDGENTRSSGQLLQWIQPKPPANTVKAKPYKNTVGLLDIGERRNWLYSTALFPTPGSLEHRIRDYLA